jgi:glycosyltransferase involved in cell wall biosynthesis
VRRYLAPESATRVAPAPEPTISVVVACYQAAETVADAVSSALRQTRPAHEVIVCDDGSTDGPEEALAAHADRIRLLRKENGGGASALNHAIAAAAGEFVAILDADDVYDERRLEAIATLAGRRPDLDIVTTDTWLERDGVRVGRYSDVNPFEVDDQRAAILETCFPGGWPAIRRRRLLDVGGFDESYAIAYDWECWLRLIHDGARAGMVDEPLMTYRVHPGSLSADTIASLRARLRMFAEAGTRWSLDAHERRVLRTSIARDRQRLAVEEISSAVSGVASRTTLLRVALRPDTPLRSRLIALRLAGRRSSRRTRC